MPVNNQGPQRGQVTDANAREGQAFDARVQEVAQVDTFARQVGQPTPNPALDAVIRFGKQAGLDELEKNAKANFAAGQALRAGGEAMAEGALPPTRKGFEAMDAKITTQEWYNQTKEEIDFGDNALYPEEYAAQLQATFKDLLTGDKARDELITTAALPLMQDLGRYHANANTKQRQSQAITQSTADVTNHINAIEKSIKNADAEGESGARESLQSALRLPAIINPELKQQTYADLATLALDLGNTDVYNYVRENGIEFDPRQEKSLLAAESRYNNKENTRLNIKYQNDTADMESALAAAVDTEDMRELLQKHQETWPGRKTNEYYISREASWDKSFNLRAADKVFGQAYKTGTLATVKGVSKKDIDNTIRAQKNEILSDDTLTPEAKEQHVLTLWHDNNLVDPDLKTELTAGLTQSLSSDGTVHQNFEPAFNKMLNYYNSNPDLALKHVGEEGQKLFLNVKALTLNGTMDIMTAANQLVANRENVVPVTEDVREDIIDADQDAIDNIMGKQFWSWRGVTDTLGVTKPIHNEAAVRGRLTSLSKAFRASGYVTPEGAAEAARQAIMQTSEQLGNSLVANGGKPVAARMGIPPQDVQPAIESTLDDIAAVRPDWDRDNLIIMGDPRGNGLVVANLNEFGVPTGTVQVNLETEGKHWNNRKALEFQGEEAAAVRNSKDRRDAIDFAVSTGQYTEEYARFAYDNVGHGANYLLHSEIAKHKDAQEMAKYGARSQEEMDRIKKAESLYSQGPQPTLTPEQQKYLQEGNWDKLSTVSGELDITSPATFIDTSLQAATVTLQGTSIFPEVATAMAALESGWGKKVKGNNYFGIKGEGQTVTTHEVVDGERTKIQDNFKEFTGFGSSLEGLKQFLTSNPRYEDALKADTAEKQIQAIADAGYATDPEYASKLKSILKRIKTK